MKASQTISKNNHSYIFDDIKNIILSELDSCSKNDYFNLELTTEQLTLLFQKKLNKTHNITTAINLLKNGFEIKPNIFLFQKTDFIRENSSL